MSPFNFDRMPKKSGQINQSILVFFFCIILFAFIVFYQMLYTKFSLFLILACIVFTVSFFNSKLAMSVLIFSMLLSPEFTRGGAAGREVAIRLEDILLLVIFLGWLANMAVNKELGLLKTTILNKPIGIYVLICLISSLLAIIEGRVSFRSSFFFNLKYIEYFLLFFMVVNNIKDIKDAKTFVFLLLLTCFLVSLYALKNAASGERVTAPFEKGGGEPNTFSGYLVFMMALILGLILYLESWKKRALLMLLFGLLTLPLVRTLSRSGWLSFFPMFLSTIILTKRFKLQLVVILIIAAVLVPRFLSKQVYERINETFTPYKEYRLMGKSISLDESTAARIDTFNMALEKFSKHPILGNGVPIGTVVDNQYARILSETGIIGIMVFFWLLLILYKLGWVSYKNSADGFSKAISLGFVSGLSGLLIHSFSASTFIIIRIMEPFWFLAGILVVLPELQKSEALNNV